MVIVPRVCFWRSVLFVFENNYISSFRWTKKYSIVFSRLSMRFRLFRDGKFQNIGCNFFVSIVLSDISYSHIYSVNHILHAYTFFIEYKRNVFGHILLNPQRDNYNTLTHNRAFKAQTNISLQLIYIVNVSKNKVTHKNSRIFSLTCRILCAIIIIGVLKM